MDLLTLLCNESRLNSKHLSMGQLIVQCSHVNVAFECISYDTGTRDVVDL